MRPIRVMTFNVQGFGGWGHATASTRASVIARAIQAVRPDVVGLQESVQSIHACILDHGRLTDSRKIIETEWDSNPILFNRPRLLLSGHESFGIAGYPHRWSPETIDVIPRQARAAIFDVDTWPEGITVVNMHLDSRSWRSRLFAAEEVAARHPNAVLLGDFNEDAWGELHTFFMTHGWKDAGGQSREVGTFRRYGIPVSKRMDWILVPEDFTIERYAVMEPEGPSFSSDHLPVVADVRPSR